MSTHVYGVAAVVLLVNVQLDLAGCPDLRKVFAKVVINLVHDALQLRQPLALRACGEGEGGGAGGGGGVHLWLPQECDS